MLTHAKARVIEGASQWLRLTFSAGGAGLRSNVRSGLTQQILFGVTEANMACGSRLKVRKIEAKGNGTPAEFRALAREVVQEASEFIS